MQATARAFANIAFIKYWGNANDALRIPVNSSLSMNLDGLYTDTTVIWDEALTEDSLLLNGEPAADTALQRVSTHLDMLRERLDIQMKANVISENNFPMGAGIASSASAFAALTLAATHSIKPDISERELTTLARRGSGSASRSIPAGFVEWYKGTSHEDSYAETFAPIDSWDLVDVIAIVSAEHKHTTSSRGHHTAATSDLQMARIGGANKRLQTCKHAIKTQDFAEFAQVVEHDSNLMHAIMMTSVPPLFYWLPPTLTIMDAVRHWRAEGLSVCYTLDAGPNVHCICIREHAEAVRAQLSSISGVVDVKVATVGGAAHIL